MGDYIWALTLKRIVSLKYVHPGTEELVPLHHKPSGGCWWYDSRDWALISIYPLFLKGIFDYEDVMCAELLVFMK